MLIQGHGIFRPRNVHYGVLSIVLITDGMKKQANQPQLQQQELQQLPLQLEETRKTQALIET